MSIGKTFSFSPVCDEEGNRYVPAGALHYDGVVMRCRAVKETAGGRSKESCLLESFRPKAFSPHSPGVQTNGRTPFFGHDTGLGSIFRAAQNDYLQRISMRSAVNQAFRTERSRPFVLTFRSCKEPRGTLVIETGYGETVRDFAEKRHPVPPSAPYVLQCLDIVHEMTEAMQTLKRDWLLMCCTPDTVFIPADGGPVQLTDAAFLLPRSAISAQAFSPAAEWWLPTEGVVYPPLLEALVRRAVQSQRPSCLLALLESAGLYSISQLLCYLLFLKTWTLDAETLSIRFPSVGVFQNGTVREDMEALVSCGLGLRGSAHGQEAFMLFSRRLTNMKGILEKAVIASSSESVFRSCFSI